MDTFIKKQEYNYIKNCLFDLNNAFRNSIFTPPLHINIPQFTNNIN